MTADDVGSLNHVLPSPAFRRTGRGRRGRRGRCRVC